ncbi:BON domain-containing protein [Paraburkholderia sp. JHI869]|uniref:BON domain-containing protein n=1 Tax=Paraburkholderia sp. JHI869 TaxID=3112959 RepID=UPI0031736C91
MKRIFKAGLAIGILIALVNNVAIAQGGSASEIAASAATPASSAKAIRSANRELQKQVRRALTHTKGLDASGISVRASNGAVTLQGLVREQSQVELAMEVAKGVPGVTSVSGQLKVLPYGH